MDETEKTKEAFTVEKKTIKIGLIPKLIIAIILGILFGTFLPEWCNRLIVTFSSIFSTFLAFVIPLMIVAYVTMGIANLRSGAGKLLVITVALAFILGLCLSTMRGKTIGDTLYHAMEDFSGIIDKVLHTVIIPLLPLYICGTFTNMTYSGKTFAILGILWKVFLVVIAMHLIYICVQFLVAGLVSGKNPFRLIRNQVPGYATAIGTVVDTIYRRFIMKAPAGAEG